MKILLTNDDGYQSIGLQQLCSQLSCDHEVYVVAPDSQKSSTSHLIHFHKDVKFKLLDNYFGAKVAYISSGAPADCAKFGILQLGVNFDLLISGPNDSENYGNDVLYSGTIGAAEEGVLCDVKSIAISRLGYGGEYTSCIKFLKNNLPIIEKIDLGRNLLNINVPNLPYEKIKGVIVTTQGDNKYNDYYLKHEGDNWYLTGEKIYYKCASQDDVSCSEAGYITVTPISVKQTNEELVHKFKNYFTK
ncbi:MAG: 5'/3'-nucleotidase SurE [Clostridia bacterium]|nr:5'/3'-nucleotidase SurE [Clostridia bacterium]